MWHLTAYPGSDIANYIVFIFWGIGAVMTVATGSFVPFWVMHISNNFFIDFSRLYSSDIVLITAISVIIGFIALYVLLYRNNLFGGGKKEKAVLV